MDRREIFPVRIFRDYELTIRFICGAKTRKKRFANLAERSFDRDVSQ